MEETDSHSQEHVRRGDVTDLTRAKANPGRQAKMPKEKPSMIAIKREGKRLVIKAGIKELDAHPKVGELAPDFTLKAPGGKKKHRFYDSLGKRPMFLVFGSFT